MNKRAPWGAVPICQGSWRLIPVPCRPLLEEFLKEVGVTSQHEIERLVQYNGLEGKGELRVRMVLTAEGTPLEHIVEGTIDLG